MAKILLDPIDFLDVVIKVDKNRQLAICSRCHTEMIVFSIITANEVDKPDIFTVNHNLFCPGCKGVSLISLRSK